MTWEKLPSVDPGHNPCLHCPDPLPVLAMESIVAVGFGAAYLERDGRWPSTEKTRSVRII